MKTERVKTAIVGCGMISSIYIRNLKELFSIIDLRTLCSKGRASAEEKAEMFGIPSVMTLEEIAASDIELVVNLTPAPAHYGVLKQMLEAGKHVYTEKMFTTGLEESRELVDLAERKGLWIGCAPDTVLGAGVQTARYLIDAGMIGDITGGTVTVCRNQNLNSEMYRFLQQEGGAIPYDVGIYYIGALVALLGPVKRVTGYGAPALYHRKERLFDERNAESWTVPGHNILAGALEFTSGALVSVHFNGNTAGEPKHIFELYGTRGALGVGDPNTFNGVNTVHLPENDPVTMPFTHGYDGVNMLEKAPFDYYGHRGIGVAETAWSIRNGRMNRLSGDYGLHCQEILQGLDESARTGSTYEVRSSCTVRPLAPGYYSSVNGRTERGDAEMSLME